MRTIFVIHPIFIEKGIEFEINGKKFERMGTKTPSEIYELLGLGENCFQLQMEPHFLINQTPSEIYEKLSNPIIDEYIMTIDKKTKEIKSKKDNLEEEKTKLLSYVNKYSEIEKIAKRYLILKNEVYKRLTILYKKFLLKKITYVLNTLIVYYKSKKLKEIKEKITSINDLYTSYYKYVCKLKKEKYNRLFNGLNRLNDLFKLYQRLYIQCIIERKKKIHGILKIIEVYEEKLYQLKVKEYVKKKKSKETVVKLYKLYKLYLIKKLKEEIKRIKNELPDICPLCNNTLKKED